MIKLGIEMLDDHLALFNNKRVGLITNPTGVDQALKTTIEHLREKTNLTALYAPEHGVRGDLQAGKRLVDYHDEETGLPVYSLYGETKKPTKAMLEGIDILCFDIQDVGARFYTYIYTMAYAMMGAKEHGKTFVVFDRPNPLGNKVEGNILDTNFRSFVGYYPLPQRHGLTTGELALLFNEQFDIHCDLKVITMKNYDKTNTHFTYDYPYVAPSPNLPTKDSVFYYMMTYAFEGTNISEGRGTTKPFQIIGAPFFNPDEVIKQFNQLEINHVQLRKTYFTPTFSKHANTLCAGVEVYIKDFDEVDLASTGLKLLMIVKKIHPEFTFNNPYKEGMHPMIDLLFGTDKVRLNHLSIDEVDAFMKEDLDPYLKQKASVTLYE